MHKTNLWWLSVLLLLTACHSEEPIVNKKPNVLLIIADDHGYADISLQQLTEDVQTPHLDSLALSGTYFTNAYASSPICSPSRIALLTGAYHQRQGVYWYGGPGIAEDTIPTLAEILKQEGYTTGWLGKFHYGNNDADTSHRSFPLNHGFDELFGFHAGRKHYLIHNSAQEADFRQKMEPTPKPKQSLKMEGFFQQKERVDVEGFSTKILGKSARNFMRKHAKEEYPFFLSLSFNAVHNFTHQLPPEYLKEKGLNGYRDWDPEIETYYDWYLKGRYPLNPEGRAHYLGQLYYLDQEIGKITSFLEEQGLRENTIVIYIGDNGGSTPIYANNYPFKGSKYTMYEGGLRVPLMISWPKNFIEGGRQGHLVSAMDIVPTICDALEIAPPEVVDGKSLYELLTSKMPVEHHQTLFWWGNDQAAVRSGNWKYRWASDAEDSAAAWNSQFEGVDLELGEYLYDIKKDVGENNNVIEQHPEIAAQLKEQLENWKKEVFKK